MGYRYLYLFLIGHGLFPKHAPHFADGCATTFQLQWRHAEATDLSQTLRLDASSVAYYSLAFGVSSEHRSPEAGHLTTSSGITWADCVHLTHAGPYYSALTARRICKNVGEYIKNVLEK